MPSEFCSSGKFGLVLVLNQRLLVSHGPFQPIVRRNTVRVRSPFVKSLKRRLFEVIHNLAVDLNRAALAERSVYFDGAEAC